MKEMIKEKIHKIALVIESELIQIRHELHRHPELGLQEKETHDIICRQLEKIPGIEIQRHAAEGTGVIALMRGKKGDGKTVMLRADMDALPITEGSSSEYASKNEGCMHACGHDGHMAWIIGAAKILGEIQEEWGGCVKFVFQPAEEIGKGADALIHQDRVLENPDVDMAFAAHGWPSIESGKIGISRKYAFGCVGTFEVCIRGRKGHASWPEQVKDPIAAANEIYQHIPAILSRKIKATEAKVMSVTYMNAGEPKIKNIIPEFCRFGGTMRTTSMEVMHQMAEELERKIRGVCEVYGTEYELAVKTNLGSVKNHPTLVEPVCQTVQKILGKEKAFIIEEDNLGGENFAEYSSRVPAIYMFVGIRPEGKKEIPGLHSTEYQFDDGVLSGASEVFAALAYEVCNGELEAYRKNL